MLNSIKTSICKKPKSIDIVSEKITIKTAITHPVAKLMREKFLAEFNVVFYDTYTIMCLMYLLRKRGYI